MISARLFGAAVLAAALFANLPAHAGHGCSAYPGPFGGSWWGRNTFPSLDRFSPPYFALYPPVYYSGEVAPRTYGHSPFAYPALPRPTRVERPVMIWNHFVEPAAETPAEEASQPIGTTAGWVENPFCRPILAARD